MSLKPLATATASTKRAQIASGKRGDPVTLLVRLECTPLYPADPGQVNNLLQRLKLETPYNLYETFVMGAHDIQNGDTFVVDGNEYVVRAAATWEPSATSAYMHLTVEAALA
jgi:hypothetical protein